MPRRIVGLVFVMVLMLCAGCSDHEVVQPSVTEYTDVTYAKLDNVEIVKGFDDNKAKYALYRPVSDSWNGDLAVFAHGYSGQTKLPVIDPLRDGLLDMGYAVAYSSYSEAGFAIKEGAEDTKRLNELFEEHFEAPDEIYLIGYSLGGLISLMLVEQYPDIYEGALSVAGPIGGSRMAIDYVNTNRVLFDHYYPGVLLGSVEFIPKNAQAGDAFNAAVTAMQADVAPAYELGSIDQAYIVYADEAELLSTIAGLINFQFGMFADLYERAEENPFFDNVDVVYTGTSDDELLNQCVDRYSSSPLADDYFEMYYQPTGVLELPVLHLHNTRDWLVSASHVDAYEQIVTAAGCADMFSYQMFDRYGHGYAYAEMLTAFEDLVAWAESLE